MKYKTIHRYMTKVREVHHVKMLSGSDLVVLDEKGSNTLSDSVFER